MAQLVAVWSKNRTERLPFKKKPGEEHIMICGSVTHQMLSDFITDLYAVPENYCKVLATNDDELAKSHDGSGAMV